MAYYTGIDVSLRSVSTREAFARLATLLAPSGPRARSRSVERSAIARSRPAQPAIRKSRRRLCSPGKIPRTPAKRPPQMTGRLWAKRSQWVGLCIGLAIIVCLVALVVVGFTIYLNYSETADCTTTFCGDYVTYSCHPEVDGPVSYWRRTSALLPTWISRGELVATCSFGECRGPTPASPKAGACRVDGLH